MDKGAVIPDTWTQQQIEYACIFFISPTIPEKKYSLYYVLYSILYIKYKHKVPFFPIKFAHLCSHLQQTLGKNVNESHHKKPTTNNNNIQRNQRHHTDIFLPINPQEEQDWGNNRGFFPFQRIVGNKLKKISLRLCRSCS